ncbi:MAG: DUF4399 domain-containing protein [Thermomicrobiales bacterium]
MLPLLRRPKHLRLLVFVLVATLVLPALPASAQSEPDDNAITPITLTLTLAEGTADGTIWVDGEGLHVRDFIVEGAVEGDIGGQVSLTTDLDWYGPCSPDGTACDGDQESFSQVEISGETGTWTGTLAIERILGDQPGAHGILIGRQGANDQVIALNGISYSDTGATQLSGNLVTLTGPIGGVQLSGSACVTGPTTADGGFIGTQGLVQDSGPLRVHREVIGGANPTGIYGDLRQIGQKGSLSGLFIATLDAGYAYGSFVLVGESGPYAGMLGYGRATASIDVEPRCRSGLQITSTWTGQARYLADPAAFLAPRVYFESPEHGQVVTNPVVLELGSDHVAIEPAGEAREGSGHFTVIVDAPCLGPGELMPVDDQHIQLNEGETSIELNLFSGEHRLCLQLTDGAGIAQPATDIIHVFVAPSGGNGPGEF